MDLRALEVFVGVAHAPSLISAARNLRQPLSTVSRRLQALERELDTVLVQRTTRSLRLTDAGRALLAAAEGPLRELRLAAARLRERSGVPAGCLRIAAAPTVATHVLPELLARFVAQHRAVTIELLVGAASTDLRAAGVDVAVRVGAPVVAPSFVVRRLWRSRTLVVAAPRYLATRATPASVAALAQHDVVALEQAPDWRFEEEAQATGVTPRVLVQSADVARRLCIEGVGLAILPEFLVAADVRSGRLREIQVGARPAAKDVYVIYAEENRRLPRVRAFVDALLESRSPRVSS